jgi:hypothetical protein
MDVKQGRTEMHTLPVDDTCYLCGTIFVDKYIIRMKIVVPKHRVSVNTVFRYNERKNPTAVFDHRHFGCFRRLVCFWSVKDSLLAVRWKFGERFKASNFSFHDGVQGIPCRCPLAD